MEPYLIGCVINLCGSVVINVGTNLIKYHHHLESRASNLLHRGSNATAQFDSLEHANPQFKKSFWWYAGFSLFFVGNVANFVSMGFAAQSLLAGLGSVQFLTNVICSWIIMKHRVTCRILVATFLIIFGNSLIVLFASHKSQQLSVNQLWGLYENTAYIVYMVILVVILLTLFLYYKETKKRLIAQLPSGAKLNYNNHKMLPFSYATISAIIGTQSVLLAKSSSGLLRATLGGNNQFTSPFTYFILCAWVLSMVFWLYRMNRALRKFDGVFIIPVLQVVWTLFSIIGGGIYFQEFNEFDSVQVAMFTLGVLVVIGGVYLLAPQSTGGHSHNQSSLLRENSSDVEMNAIHRRRSAEDGNEKPYRIAVGGNSNSSGNSDSNNSQTPASQPPVQIRQIIANRNTKYLPSPSLSQSNSNSAGSNTNRSLIHVSNNNNHSSDSLLSDSPELPPLPNPINELDKIYSDGEILDINLDESVSAGSNAPLNPLHPYSSSHSYLQIGAANSLNNSFRLNSENSLSSYSNENSQNLSNSGEFDDSFTVQSAPASPAIFGVHSQRYIESKKKTSGMSLFSMPMIDLDNDEDDD